MDETPYKIPLGATIDRETGEMTMQYRQGTREEFIAIMRPFFAASQVLSQSPEYFAPADRQQK